MPNESRSCFLRKRELPRSASPLPWGWRAPALRGFVGKGLTAGLASPPAPAAGNSWWVLCCAGELSSPKKFLANTRPGRTRRGGSAQEAVSMSQGGNNAPLSRDRRDTRSHWIAPPKNPPLKEQGPFASGNPINWFRKWKSVPANGALIDSRFSLQRPSGDKVNSNVI